MSCILRPLPQEGKRFGESPPGGGGTDAHRRRCVSLKRIDGKKTFPSSLSLLSCEEGGSVAIFRGLERLGSSGTFARLSKRERLKD
jgi:hypothetical protein